MKKLFFVTLGRIYKLLTDVGLDNKNLELTFIGKKTTLKKSKNKIMN